MFRFDRLALATLAVAIPVQAGLIITPTFDSTITGDSNAVTIENTINAAIAVFESTYTNPINVAIYFQEGGGLGESEFIPYQGPYPTFYNDLAATNANPAAVAGLTANGGAGVNNPVTGTSSIEAKGPNLRAVGIAAPADCVPSGTAGSMTCTRGTGPGAEDGIISLNTNITFPPNASNGASYSLLATAEHEIDEILGLGSGLANTSAASGTVTSTNPDPEDLFRYDFNGNRVFAANCATPAPAFFSYSGATDLAEFNNECNSEDFGDWRSGATLPQVQDATATTGTAPSYGPNEVAAMSAIGFTVSTPEPAGWILLLTAVSAFAFARRRAVLAKSRVVFARRRVR